MGRRLLGDPSPYLRQHADDPVDWYPWGEEALRAARESGRPILLSIGYSACHWCHVMARESFSDPEIARVMNEHFVCIKVDREARPDIDRIYQLAHALLTRHGGGWPLTMFLTPDDQRPFFGGTYFPREPRGGLPGFRDLLERVAAFHREQQPALRAQNDALVEALARIDAADGDGALDEASLASARDQLEARFDREHGGFGDAPKFPQPAAVTRLLRHWRAGADGDTPDLKALYLATLTLHRMAEGGLFDQVGGGVFRYSTDAAWRLPHFEKMLSDNALMLSLYAEGWRATGEPLYAQTADAIASFLLRDLRDAGGAFHTSLGADSAGGEGAYYLWSRAEIESVLGAEHARLFNARYGLAPLAGHGTGAGAGHLYAARGIDEVATEHGLSPRALETRLATLRAALLARRGERPPPARDDKILTGWNALAIRALAEAGQALGRPELVDAAGEAMAFLRANLFVEGRLHALWQGGRAAQPAFLDDHAFLADAALALLECRFDRGLLELAASLAGELLSRFAAADGGFHFTAADAEPLMHRSLTFADDALPSGNAVAAKVLLRLGHLLGEERYLRAGERVLRAASGRMRAQPLAHLSMIEVLREYLDPPPVVILRGDAATCEAWRDPLRAAWIPGLTVLALPVTDQDLPEPLRRPAPADGARAWICRGSACEAPVDSPEALLSALGVDSEPAT